MEKPPFQEVPDDKKISHPIEEIRKEVEEISPETSKENMQKVWGTILRVTIDIDQFKSRLEAKQQEQISADLAALQKEFSEKWVNYAAQRCLENQSSESQLSEAANRDAARNMFEDKLRSLLENKINASFEEAKKPTAWEKFVVTWHFLKEKKKTPTGTITVITDVNVGIELVDDAGSKDMKISDQKRDADKGTS